MAFSNSPTIKAALYADVANISDIFFCFLSCWFNQITAPDIKKAYTVNLCLKVKNMNDTLSKKKYI